MDAICEWLRSNRDYDTGAKLYLAHGTDPLLRKIFMEPASEFKKKRLFEALRAILEQSTGAAINISISKEVAINRTTVTERSWPKELDHVMQALHAQWKPLYSEMMNLSARIFDIAKQGVTDPAKKKEAGAMAHKILDLDDACEEIYRKRGHYEKYKTLPEEKPLMDLIVDPKKIPMALANAERYVRAYKNKIKINQADVNAAAKLKNYEWAVEQYQQMLNLL